MKFQPCVCLSIKSRTELNSCDLRSLQNCVFFKNEIILAHTLYSNHFKWATSKLSIFPTTLDLVNAIFHYVAQTLILIRTTPYSLRCEQIRRNPTICPSSIMLKYMINNSRFTDICLLCAATCENELLVYINMRSAFIGLDRKLLQ